MSITAGVEFDTRSGHFIGDVTLPDHSGVATHSLVLCWGVLLRAGSKLLPIISLQIPQMVVSAPIVLSIIKRCYDVRLNVAAVSCDMGGANRAMWKELGIVCGKQAVTINSFPHPCIPDYKICVLADVPQVIKNVRNHLVNGQNIVLPMHFVQKFNLPCDTVCIAALKKLVEYQKDKDLKPASNLTAKHIDPSHFDKMKVSQAMNIFSHSVSAALRLMVETNWDRNILTTRWFLEMMNKWFDLM
jgi:hypothetical protein